MTDQALRRTVAWGGAHGLATWLLTGVALGAWDPSAADANTRLTAWGAIEGRAFVRTPLAEEQHGSGLSIAAQPELYWRSADGRQSLTAAAFGRLDQHDAARSHADLRELLYVYSATHAEFRAGVGKVFWGVTESIHLVDIINSTDQVEGPDGEEKLGQPMIAGTLISPAGNVSVFLLPWFRVPTTPGAVGRLRPPLPVERDRTEYESSDHARHLDWALRWSRSIGPFDAGLSYFAGTSRAPRYRVDENASARPVLVPVHDLIDQTGFDLQATTGGWLWKLEAISVGDAARRFTAAAGGFEYTLGGWLGTAADLGIVVEYLFDDRGKTFASPFDNDLFAGARLALNNVSGTSVLAGSITDLENGTNAALLEAATRLRDGLTFDLEVRASIGASENDPLYVFRRDAYVQATLTRYF